MNIDMEKWADYYSNEDNLTRIAYQCRYREVIVIKHLDDRNVPIRPMKVYKPQHLTFWIERLGLKTVLFDLYHSNASVKLPALTSNIKELDYWRKYLTEHWVELCNAYDIFVDVDIDDMKQRPDAEKMAREVAHILAQQYPNVELWDTTRGFHCICKGQFNPEFVKETVQDICCYNNIPMSMPIKDKDGIRYIPKNKQWVELKPDTELQEIKKPNVDTSIYDGRRIRRVPHSLHSKTGKPMERL
jgi:hypothetical protein